MREHRVGHEEFLAPGRDRAGARLVHQALERLADGSAGSVLKEMAEEVLSGRMGLDEAMRIGPYAQALGDRMRSARTAWERTPDAVREREVSRAGRFLAARADPSDPP